MQQTLKDIRTARGMAITELAEKSGLERSLVRFFETGERPEYINPRLGTLIALADVLDVDPKILFDIAKERVRATDDFQKRIRKIDKWMEQNPEKGYRGEEK